MKRKILSLILVFMLLPVASLFAACKDKGYNLNNLQNDFNAIQTENENIKKVGNKLVFDYSKHENLKTVLETYYPYTEIDSYNYVYENIMYFVFDYIDECSFNSATSDASKKDAIKSNLHNLKKAIRNVDLYVNMLAEVINVSYDDDIFTNACMARFENLLISYEELFKSAIRFSNTLADLYFNNILINGNPNIAAMDSSNFDVNLVVNNFDARMKYQLTNLSACYVEMYIDGGNLPEQIVTYDAIFDLGAFDYQTNITKVKAVYDAVTAYEKANTNKQVYYELSVQAYNIQVALENDNSKFYHACGDIAYAGLDLSKASANEKLCADIIDARYSLVTIYNNVLADMLKITGV